MSLIDVNKPKESLEVVLKYLKADLIQDEDIGVFFAAKSSLDEKYRQDLGKLVKKHKPAADVKQDPFLNVYSELLQSIFEGCLFIYIRFDYS